jgi:hypothetical protein
MKKMNFFKILLTLVMAFTISGASAQILTDYIETVAGSESVDTVITGTTTRLYVYPDLVYSPTYDAATNANLGANARWTWYNSLDGSGGAIKAAANENWVELTHGAVGTYPVSVEESNTAGSCTGAVSAINVEIIAEPTVAFTVADGTPVLGSAGSPFTFCAGDGRLATDYPQAAFTSSIIGSPSYQIQYTIAVDTSHDAGASWVNIPARTETFSGAAGTQVDAGDGATYNLAQPTGGFAILNQAGTDYPTRYTYTMTGLTDRITRKCDYLTNPTAAANSWSWYDTGAETIVVIINPTPVTGPIYHISNMWAN